MDLHVERVDASGWERLRAIRLAALAEAPEMFGSTLERELAFEDAEWRRRAARPASFVASRDGTDVGLAGVFEVDPGAWMVMSMWVAPAARGTGVVQALLDRCEAFALAQGVRRLVLGVMEDNPRGLATYARAGYVATGDREHVRDGRYELFLAKTLDANPA